MKNNFATLLACVLCGFALRPHNVEAQGTSLTYQGKLNDASGLANGSYDLQFTVRNALTGGSIVGASLARPATPVSNGIFTVTLDFGAGVFTGADRWLEIAVRTNGASLYTTLSPCQPITSAPYAIFAQGAAAEGLIGVLPATAVPNHPLGMVLIPAGVFTMGDTLDDISWATPIQAMVSGFYMDMHEVTLSKWKSVYYWATNQGYAFVNSGLGKAANHPVHTVNWYDCIKWCNARSEQAGRAPVYYIDEALTQVYRTGEVDDVYPNWQAKGYRLPTEAEWEKAARGGLENQRFPWGNFIDGNLANYVGFTANYGAYDFGPDGPNALGSNGGDSAGTSPVGSFEANRYGLYDMAGNIYEWCWDWYATPYGQPTNVDPVGPANEFMGSGRVRRGGVYYREASFCRNAYRSIGLPSIAASPTGFRSVLPIGH